MKKWSALFLALVMLLSGCAVVQESVPQTEYEEVLLMQEVDLTPRIEINPVLYFLNRSRTKLAAESRIIQLGQNDMPEVAVVRALIDGPVSDELQPVAQGFQLEKIELMPDVINVYLKLPDGEYKSNEALTNTKIAIASTLADFSGKKYVNVLINGLQTGYADQVNQLTTPTGALQKINDLADEYNLLEQKAVAQNPDMYAILYFLDSSETLMLPEARRLVFKDREDYVSTLVEELVRGPENTYNHMPIIDNSVELIDYETVIDEEGRAFLQLNFNKEPVVYTDRFVDGKRMALAALTYTLVDFIPDLYGVKIMANGYPVDGVVYTPEDFNDLIGAEILIYLPNSDTNTTLAGVERIIPQQDAYFPSALLRELMSGPVWTDSKELWPAMPNGISMEQVRSVYIANDIMVVDFDESIRQTLASISAENEYVMIFSIVNTLTSYEGIRRVQFLIDGERTEYLGGGKINVIDPLIKNPGIIK